MDDDYISRQDAVGALANYIMNVDKVYSTGKLTQDDCIDCAKSVLDDLSSADVAPVVHSRWSDEMERVDTYHPFAGFETDYYHRCLNCGRRGKGFSWNFCPYCGAKMDEEE